MSSSANNHRPSSGGSARTADRLFQAFCRFCGWFILVVSAALVVVLVSQSVPVLRHLGKFQLFATDDWDPNHRERYWNDGSGEERRYDPETDPTFVEGENPDGRLYVTDTRTGRKFFIGPQDDDGTSLLFDATNDQEAGKITSRVEPRYGIWVFVYGTLITSLIAMLIAVPLGVGSAAFLSEIAPAWIRRTCSFLIELLAAIPSVVYGFWGLFFLAPGLHALFLKLNLTSPSSGQGLLAAGIILSIMILPYITAIAFDVCRAVPTSQRQGALALGASRWQMIRGTVLPYARPGITAGCFLALGRALGETMAVTMLIGNVRYFETALTGRGDSIAGVIANQLNEASDEYHRAALVTLALILFLITAVTNVLARRLIGRVNRPKIRGTAEKSSVGTQQPPPAYERWVVTPARRRRMMWENRLMTWVLAACQILTVIPLFLILGYIGYRGVTAINWEFFVKLPVGPNQTGGGLGHAIVGSAIMVVTASLLAVPIGVFAAVYIREYHRSRTAGAVRFTAEVLGGVPSIVLGIFSYALLVNPPWGGAVGFSAWAGIFSLAVMMLPVIIRASEEAMKLVPDPLRQAGYALGASQRQTVMRVILPASLPAVITGILLAMGRIAGETAPLLLTAKGSSFWPRSLSEQTPFLPGYIFYYSKSADAEQQRQAWAAALVLLSAILLLNIAIRAAAGKRIVAAGRAD